MEVGPTLVADPQALELVEPGEGPLYHPASAAEARAVDDTSAGDEGLDPALPQQAAVLVLVVAPVSEEPLGPVARASTTAPDPGYRVQKRDQLCDVMPISAGQGYSERGAETIDDHMVLGAGAAAIHRRRPDMSPPFKALMWEPSIAASSISSEPAARSSVRSASCKRGQTPASVQSRSRRQAVTPEQPTTSLDTSRQATPLRRT